MSAIFQNIYKLVRITVIIGWMIGITACSDRMSEPCLSSDSIMSGDSITVTGNLNIPVMPEAKSRGVIDDTPGNGLKLTLFEFDYVEGNSSASFLTNIYKAELTTTSAVENGGTVTFKVTLKSASTPKVLHLVVGEDYFSSDYGSEATVLPSLTVGTPAGTGIPIGGYRSPEAYWGRVVFTKGYTTLDNNGNPKLLDEVKTNLTNVPVIRNFAKISVSAAASLTDFEFLGFDLINIPTSGTVVPWIRSSLSTPDLLSGYNMKTYPEITYTGIVPTDVGLRNTEANVRAGNFLSFSTDPCFIYEHPYESTRRTYIIIHGRYRTGPYASWQDGYYKIDIGKLDNDGIFNHYNILRNIHYNIVITAVDAPGEATLADAVNAVPFNNISAATETSSMLSISDGKNLLITNTLNHVIVNNSKPIEFMYRYITGVNNGSGGKREDNDFTGLKVIGLKPDPDGVIESVVGPEKYTDDTGANWVLYKITPNEPTDEVKTQEFTIVDSLGLGRTIHLILRNPWQYAPIMSEDGTTSYTATVAPGERNLYIDPDPQPVSSGIGQPLTVYFNLPDGLPEAMFPLKFTIESKHQWIENNKIGNLVVTSGPSLFESSKIAIAYIKTVSYSEYQHLYYDGSNDLNVNSTNDIDVNSTNVNHTVRCRFLTIAESEDGAEAEIRIHNDYFAPDASVKFKRVVLDDDDDAEEML